MPLAALVVDRVRPQVDASGTEEETPLIWYDVIKSVSFRLTNSPPRSFQWRFILRSANVFLSWAPSIRVVVTALVGRSVIYLCWGVPDSKSLSLFYMLRKARLYVVLRTAKTILVNDPTTQAEIGRMTGRQARIIPYLVDTNYFLFSPISQRREFLLVPGDNGRNEELVFKLASLGVEIVRVTKSEKVAEHYKRKKCVSVRYRVPYSELRLLYQQAAAVILPLELSNHAAGQTALLEAVACGAPVVISRFRTSQIVEGPSIVPVESMDVQEWMRKIDEVIERTRRDTRLTQSAAEKLRQTHHPNVLRQILMNEIDRAAFA